MSPARRASFTVFALIVFAAQFWLSDDWAWLKVAVVTLFLVSFLGSVARAARKRSRRTVGSERR